MGFLDKARAAAEQAASKAKDGVEDVQTKRELGQAYGELGRATFDLVESGELSHPALEEIVVKIRALQKDDTEAAEAAAGDETADAVESPAAPA